MKTCFKCKQTLNENMFYNKHRYCKSCHKETVRSYQDKNKEKVLSNGRIYNIKKRYGITQSDYDKMFVEQNGKCAICGSSEIKRTNSKHFCIDHCNTTNKVRGLLCRDCNFAIGLFKDNIKTLENAIQYLSKTNQ